MDSEILNPGIDYEHREFNSEQKTAFGKAWAEMIVDNVGLPENIDKMSPDEIKKWLFESIMKDTEKFTEELGLQIDNELVEKIKKEENSEDRSAFELEYIKKVHAGIDIIVQNFTDTKDKSTKWDSWPKRMRETKEFNCVGATLLGIYMFEKGGIKSYCGNPHGHVINIAQLSNGEWWYVDLRNGKRSMAKIEPEEAVIDGVRTLKINHPNIIYNLIPVYDNSEIVESALGNLSALEHEAKDQAISDENIEKIEAKKYLEKYGQNFQKTDFSLLHHVLYPKAAEFDNTEEMQKEIARIGSLRDFEKPINDYTKTLAKEDVKTLIEEIKNKKESIENLFYREDNSVMQECSAGLKKVLELYLDSFKETKDNQPEIYREAVDKLVGKIRNL